MKSAALSTLLLFVPAYAADTTAGTIQAIEEWPQARWGMTEQQVLRVFEGSARKLSSPRSSSDGRVGTVAIDDVAVGGVSLQALFLFDQAGKLEGINLTSPDAAPPTVEKFRKIEDSFSRKYREPFRSAGKDRFLSVWMLSRSVIELDCARSVSLIVRFEHRNRQTPESIARGLSVVNGKHVFPEPMQLPSWLPPASHDTEDQMANTEDRLSVSYQSNSPFGKLLGHYEDVLRAAAPIGVKYREDADGTAGVIFRAAQDQTSCTIKISRQSRVEVDCFLSAEAPTAPTPRESEVIGWTAGGSVMPVAAQSPVHQTQATSSQPAPHTDLAEAKSDLAAIQSEITAAQKIDAQYTGGLVKALSSSRIATLRQSEAALDQKLSSYKAGVPILRLSASDTQKLSEVESEITSTRNKIGQQQIEVARYSGGLTQAMSLATLETIRQTLAFLELRRISLKYSLPQIPTAGAAPTTGAEPRKATEGGRGPSMANCLKIQTFDSSVLSTNTVFMELAWKVDVANICATPQTVRAVFTIFDKDDFELDSASQELYVPANGIGNARGRMLVSPLEKARRMAKQGASLSLR